MVLYSTLSISDTQHKKALSVTMLYHYAECRILINFRQNVITLSVVFAECRDDLQLNH